MASGRFVLRLPPPLHVKLRAAAADRDVSLNHFCTELLERGLAGAPPGTDSALIVGSGFLPPRILSAVHAAFRGVEGIVLFGSLARGEAWPSSDADLLIVLREDATVSRELYRVWDAKVAQALRGLEHEISPQFVKLPPSATEASGIWLEAALDGVVLTDPELRISATLQALRQEIVEGRAIRKTAHGQPYWVRSNSGEAA